MKKKILMVAMIVCLVWLNIGTGFAGGIPQNQDMLDMVERINAQAVSANVGLYTGIIVDVRQFPLERTFSPGIVDEKGFSVYGDKITDPNEVVLKGMVDYLTTDEMDVVVAGLSRAGSHPLIVKAVGLKDGNKNVVISRMDAMRIAVADSLAGFKAKNAVVFLY